MRTSNRTVQSSCLPADRLEFYPFHIFCPTFAPNRNLRKYHPRALTGQQYPLCKFDHVFKFENLLSFTEFSKTRYIIIPWDYLKNCGQDFEFPWKLNLTKLKSTFLPTWAFLLARVMYIYIICKDTWKVEIIFSFFCLIQTYCVSKTESLAW